MFAAVRNWCPQYFKYTRIATSIWIRVSQQFEFEDRSQCSNPRFAIIRGQRSHPYGSKVRGNPRIVIRINDCRRSNQRLPPFKSTIAVVSIPGCRNSNSRIIMPKYEKLGMWTLVSSLEPRRQPRILCSSASANFPVFWPSGPHPFFSLISIF